MINRLASVLITLIWLWGSSLQGQMSENAAAASLQQLKQSVLVVRLPSQAKKLEALADLAENEAASAEERTRAKMLWEATQADAKAQAIIIQSAFNNYFDYAPVLYMYDTATSQLTAGSRSGFFLDNKLAPSTAVLEESPYFILDVGYTDPSNSTRSFALIIKNQSYQPLPAPFPYAQRINTPALVFDQLLGRNSTEKYYRKAVIRLNKKLYRVADRWDKS